MRRALLPMAFLGMPLVRVPVLEPQAAPPPEPEPGTEMRPYIRCNGLREMERRKRQMARWMAARDVPA